MTSSPPSVGGPAGRGLGSWPWGLSETEGQPLTKDNTWQAL